MIVDTDTVKQEHRHSHMITKYCTSTFDDLHSTLQEITDVLISFRDQVKCFSDDLLLRVLSLWEEPGNRLGDVTQCIVCGSNCLW